ncbi:MAG: hypothetical protein EOP20_14010 [Hyphomicrobiales bacterium]|nr:hypothetical protein [Phenylobacterium sp.]RYE53043.1 MAG: hypothetical protein EOP20_14010 [Hyphomicrobiales bacterium]
MRKAITQQISHDAEDIYEDVARGLKRMAEHLSQGPGDALSASAIALVHSATDLADQARTRSRRLASKAGEEIREHPAAVAAIIAAAVALVGFGLARRTGQS